MAETMHDPTPVAEQKEIISNLLNTALRKGDKWYLLDVNWFKQWKKYVGLDSYSTIEIGDLSASPGPVDNSAILQDGSLKDNLMENVDYQLIPEEAWSHLVQWYGIADEKTAIPRMVIENGLYVKNLKIEIYLVKLRLCKYDELENVLNESFSKADTVANIEKKMRDLFSVPDKHLVRLWHKHIGNSYDLIESQDQTVNDLGFYAQETLVLEVQGEDGSWQRPSTSSKMSTSVSSDFSSTSSTSTVNLRSTTGGGYSYAPYNGYDDSSSRYVTKPGLCGLTNLGNTCFMNSAIQCLSNVPALTEYFVQDTFKGELNLDNPLGMKGEIAKAYADLVKQIWSGCHNSTAPRNFKLQVGRFAPQFTGYQQHDSQELMAFLLDGLHEDLNRVKKKPYVELKDAANRPEEEVAKEAWDGYRLRNNSIIVDTFHGLLKSTVVCPECTKISVTFDPFCYLSVPLPMNKERQMEVFLVPWQHEKKLTQYKLTVPKQGIVRDLCNALGKEANLDPSKLVVCDVYHHRFHQVYSYDETLSRILDRDEIYVYEVNVAANDPDTIFLPVYQREKRSRAAYTSGSSSSSGYSSYSWNLFSLPVVVPVPKRGLTYEQLYDVVLERMRRFLIVTKLGTRWWDSKKRGEDHEGSSSEGEHEREESDEDSSEKSDEVEPSLFRFAVVNSYGNSEVGTLQKDGSNVRLTDRTYISGDWLKEARNKLYDENSAEDIQKHDSLSRTNVTKKKDSMQLSECIELFLTMEKLGSEDLWYCPVCKKHQQATKKFDLWSAPQVLVIHLKRFFYQRVLRDKIDSQVIFPLTGLDLGPKIIGPDKQQAVYDLIAVSNHYGGMGGGHYTAYAKNRTTGKWYYFDDSSVSESSEQDVCTKAAYVLIYVRRDVSKKYFENGGAESTNTTEPMDTTEG